MVYTQGSILGARLFNLHQCDFLYFLDDLDAASYADNTTLYTAKENKDSVINALETSSQKLLKCFRNNFMKDSSDRSHLLLSFNEPSTRVTDGSFDKTNTKEVLLGITMVKI